MTDHYWNTSGWVIALILSATVLFAQNSSYEFEYVGRVGFPASAAGCGSTDTTGGSDVWGYTAPDGSEYAIMGVKDGVAVVRIPDLTVIAVVAGPGNFDCYWHRDIKTYQHYVYIVSEMTGANQGLMILDLQYLPDSVRFVQSYVGGSQVRSHNLSIDVNTGYAYAVNQAATGFRVISLNDPENPLDVANIISPPSPQLTHDVYARNDTLIVSEGYAGSFSIWDMTSKTSPTLLARVNIPNAGYMHNAWMSDDGNYVMTTEETNGKTVKIWDIRQIDNVFLRGEYLAPNQIAHNAHLMGSLAIISHYAYGIVAVDISDPDNPVQVAHYDTHPQSNASGYRGCWGAYPYTQGGYVYASDFNGYLTVLKLVETPLSIDPVHPVAGEYQLAQNYPNPFNPGTTITYRLPENGVMTLTVYNALGQSVRKLREAPVAAGEYTAQWDGRDDNGRSLPSGSYFYRLAVRGQTRDFEVTRKMLLIR